ncbi:tetratricopeptide repeat protein [Streptomyces sp. TRM 70361]|uniref:tetratricopeptide repeat protein n=1 Tax=Streptomyces sp. TRM 70361 TaxID=3116553 RepID=UPI002E7BEC45|nr:tetratricopeptide repeat protein [Streptomyces sp. TRM 70361]MEE1939883.1 tetratricopeptide repeat protein [Streptomyces sp. TRM 70361]
MPHGTVPRFAAHTSVHADRGSLAIGHAEHVTHHAASPPAVSWPHQVGVPPRQADCFQDRVEAGKLEHVLEGGGTAALCQVLTGMGGVGKTQLAAHHARRALRGGEVELLVWVTATAREAVVDAYARAAVEILRAAPDRPEEAARSFLAWLESRAALEGRRWLVVLDDVSDLAHLHELWPPASPVGRTLVTTRRRDAALTRRGRLVPVGLFSEAESVAYLTASLAAHGRWEPGKELAALAAELGHLPLALSQAAAYLVDAGLDCAAYRCLLIDRTRDLAGLLPDDSGLPDDQRFAVSAAWSLSVEQADRLTPVGLARSMLRLAALLDPNGIPAVVLTGKPALAYLARHRAAAVAASGGRLSRRQCGRVSARDAHGALRVLHRLSLIDHTPGTPHQAVRVHQLVQRTTRDALNPRQRDALARVAADTVYAAWPGVEHDTALAQSLRANAEALTHHTEDALYRPDPHPVLLQPGFSLEGSGQITAAADYFRRLAESVHRRFGPDHTNTLTAQLNLARCRMRAGDPAGAETILAEVLTGMERALGPDHTHTFATREYLANCRGKAGDPAGAAAALTELLTDMRRVLGPQHSEMFTVRSNLANWREKAGDPAGAAAVLTELLTETEQVLGPDHPNVLSVRGNLANCRGKAGDPAGAAAALTELLTETERALGRSHPNTFVSRSNLANWRGRAGDPAGAAAALTELLTETERVLEPGHPMVLAARRDLAHWQSEAGKAATPETPAPEPDR